MRVELPDVKVFLALLDPVHSRHDIANDWYTGIGSAGWATCPLTENGFVRILSSTSYPGIQLISANAISLLEATINNPVATHHFWSDVVSLRDRTLFNHLAIAGPKQLTDIYLLGLCQRNQGIWVTLDTRITTSSIISPHSELLRIL